MNEAKFAQKTKGNCILNLAIGEICLIDANRLGNLIDELLELPLRDAMDCCVIDEYHCLPLGYFTRLLSWYNVSFASLIGILFLPWDLKWFAWGQANK